jgi:hypothetical protein
MNETINPLGNQLMRAVLANFEAQRQEALATIELYVHVPVGIGDHPNVVKELVTATKRLSEAEEALETIQRNFLRNSDEAPPDAG